MTTDAGAAAPPTTETFGVLDDGTAVQRRWIGTAAGLRLAVIDLGAAVQSLWLPCEAGAVNVVLGGAGLEAYAKASPDYFGAVIGRVGNRIADARISVAGQTYELDANEGPHTLHGGSGGFHTRPWRVLEHGADVLRLALHSPDGDQGFPGALDVEVAYTVRDLTVSVEMTATARASTVCGLTHHTHFNLAGEGSGAIDDHELMVHASAFTPVRDDLIPTGEIADVAGTDLDLREPRRIGEVVASDHPQIRLADGLDHNVVLDHAAIGAAAVLHDPVSGRTLRLHTGELGLQVYSGQGFDGSAIGPSGRAYGPRAGIALEPQLFPDAVHHGDDGWETPCLEAGETSTTTLCWEFEAPQP